MPQENQFFHKALSQGEEEELARRYARLVQSCVRPYFLTGGDYDDLVQEGMIGLLKAFGMRNGQLRQVFLWRASFIALRGLAWGNAVGLGLCFVQRYFHVVRLSSEGYLLSEVPISLGWGWWLALNAGAVAAIVALLVVPTYIVSTVKPDESIRYE